MARTRSSRRGSALEGFANLLAASVDASDGLVCIAGRDGVVEWASASTAARLGVEPDGLAGRRLVDLVEPESRGDVAQLLGAAEDVDRVQVSLVDWAGTEVPLECHVSFAGRRFLLLGCVRRPGVRGREGELLELNDELVLQAREGFRQARRLERTVHDLEVALEASTEKLRTSFRRSIRLREEERRRVYRDLHDGAQQQLLAVGLGLDLAAEATADASLRTRLLGLRRRLDAALAAIRDIAHGIYPAALADHGIAEGIRAATHGSIPPVELHVRPLRRYPAEIEGAVYFSCVEAVQNAVKHADASLIVVEVGELEGNVVFSVRDDGCGFDPRAIRAGAGLRNIADRVRAAGGTLRVTSSLGHGATLTGTVPVRNSD